MSLEFGLEKGKQCWIPDKDKEWLSAKIWNIEKKNGKYILELATDKDLKQIIHSKIFSIHGINLKKENDDIDDLTNMVHLNEPSILNSIKTRYARSVIYTYSGIALISINPFQKMKQLYSTSQCEKYKSKTTSPIRNH